jgi:hypothetical protein
MERPSLKHLSLARYQDDGPDDLSGPLSGALKAFTANATLENVNPNEIWFNRNLYVYGEGQEELIPQVVDRDLVANLVESVQNMALRSPVGVPLHLLPMPVVLVTRENPSNKNQKYMLIYDLTQYLVIKNNLAQWGNVPAYVYPELSDYDTWKIGANIRADISPIPFMETVRVVCLLEAIRQSSPEGMYEPIKPIEFIRRTARQEGLTENYIRKLMRAAEVLKNNPNFISHRISNKASIMLVQGVKDPELLAQAVDEVVENEMSSQQVTELIRKMQGKTSTLTPTPPSLPRMVDADPGSGSTQESKPEGVYSVDDEPLVQALAYVLENLPMLVREEVILQTELLNEFKPSIKTLHLLTRQFYERKHGIAEV